MKKILIGAAIILSLYISPAYAGVTQVKVNGLVCDFCARALEKVMLKEDAVQALDVNLETKIITINFKDDQNLSDERITDLVNDAGYDVEQITHAK